MIDVQTQRSGPEPAVDPLTALLAQGQSVWQDDLSRDLLRNGDLRRRIAEIGIRGVTTNPTIFERAIAAGPAYDGDIERLMLQGKDARETFEALAVADVRSACDLFLPRYEASGAGDGFVSIEVSPGAARDPEATWAEAMRLWSAVDRPNLMVKVPGTAEALPVIEDLLAAGININITLLFSVARYERVALAYLAALERRRAAGHPIDRLASVASFFVSRVDSLVDGLLDARIAATSDPTERRRLAAIRGRTAIANAKLAYARFQAVFSGSRWEALRTAGARVQRPLWASTSPKDPAYRDVVYVEELIGPDTVNTMPRPTLDAFLHHGIVGRTVDHDVDAARNVLRRLARAGIGLDAVTDRLEEDGIAAFSRSFDSLIAGVEAKRVHLAGQVARWSDLGAASAVWRPW